MSGGLPADKQMFRQQVRVLRDALTLEQVQRESELASIKLITLLQSYGPLVNLKVALYKSINKETDVSSAVSRLTQLGARCLFPRLSSDGVMDFAAAQPQKLINGPHGLSQPQQNLFSENPEIVVAPGLCFSREFHRIGYGKGHYDRALAQLKESGATPRAVIGICYAFQLIDVFSYEKTDYQLDAIVTPEETLER